jgi:hypothetical protein
VYQKLKSGFNGQKCTISTYKLLTLSVFAKRKLSYVKGLIFEGTFNLAATFRKFASGDNRDITTGKMLAATYALLDIICPPWLG